MNVNQVVETEDGNFSISGDLTANEHNVVLSLGLNVLFAKGLMSQLMPSLDVSEVPDEGELN